MSLKWTALALVLAASPASSQSGSAVVQSPDGRIAITIQTVVKGEPVPAGGMLVYSVAFQGKPLVVPSALRLDLQGNTVPLGQSVRIVSATPSQVDETYRLLSGRASSARNHANTLRLGLEETTPTPRKLVVEVRAYNDAAAFRYLVPEQPALSEFRLAKESTEFRFSKDPFIYALVLPHYRSMYESEFIKLSASSLSNQGGVASTVLLGLPLLMEVPGVAWAAIAEADVRDYAAMYLTNPSGGWTSHKFEARLSPHPDDANLAVAGALPHASPWRVLHIGAEPGRLIESNVITSLNPPTTLADTSWIRPGRASWDWWSGSVGPDGKPAYNTATMKFYVDFAARSGFEYMLVDAGWSPFNDITKMNGRVDIPELVAYAAAKKVKVWIWLGATAVWKQMADAFPLYEKWGVAGLKIDFIERDDQEGIDFYHRVASLAARHHLMVDFHGSTKPSGLERTWPNVMGYEAVLGMEQSKAGSRDNPDHHVTLPFTRMLVGQMDYTPGAFDNVTAAEFQPRMLKPAVIGTRAHQLAMYVVYDAPIQMVADHPAAYEGQPAFEFIKSCPSSWDETRVLNGEPGEFITIARRRGEVWFVGSMTNNKSRQLDIPLGFLGPGRYTAQIYADATDAPTAPKHVTITKQTVMRTTPLKAHLAPGGGYAIRLTPAGR